MNRNNGLRHQPKDDKLTSASRASSIRCKTSPMYDNDDSNQSQRVKNPYGNALKPLPMSRSSSVCLLPTTKNLKLFNVSATLLDAFDRARQARRRRVLASLAPSSCHILLLATITSLSFLINVLIALEVFSSSFSCCRSFSRNSGESVNASVNSRGGNLRTMLVNGPVDIESKDRSSNKRTGNE